MLLKESLATSKSVAKANAWRGGNPNLPTKTTSLKPNLPTKRTSLKPNLPTKRKSLKPNLPTKKGFSLAPTSTSTIGVLQHYRQAKYVLQI